jgi:hypothetical protein
MSADEALNFSDALNSDHRPRRVGSARLEKEAEVSVRGSSRLEKEAEGSSSRLI